MEEINSIAEVVQSIGIPALFFLLFAYMILKLIPEWVKVWKTNKEAETKRSDQAAADMQAYYDERNKSYTAQMDLMNKLSEAQNQLIGQATQVIARSNIVIENNTEAIKLNSLTHDKVISALDSDLAATKEITRSLMEHDQRSQKIYTTMLRMSDRITSIDNKGGIDHE